jgi:hypothetical protein
MDIEEEIVVVENVGGVDKPFVREDVATNNSIWKVCNQYLAIHWKMMYYNLYKFKLHFGNHTTKVQFAGDFLL